MLTSNTHSPSVSKRLLSSLSSILISIALLLISGQQAVAQSKTKPAPTPNEKKDQKVTKEAAQQTLNALLEKQLAQTRIEGIGERARELDDGVMKVKVLAKVADALWDRNQIQARQFFLLAFQTIDAIKLDSKQDQRVAVAERAGGFGPFFYLRSSTLQLLARHDFRLAEEIRRSFERTQVDPARMTARLSEAELKQIYLDEAVGLATAQPQQSAGIVMAAYRSGTGHEAIGALLRIRMQNPSLADQMFSQLVAFARTHEFSSEELEILADYVVPDEGDLFLGNDPLNDATRLPMIRQFLDYVYAGLLTQSGSSNGIDPEQAETEYGTLNRLLPYFERLQHERAPLVRRVIANLVSMMNPKDIEKTVTVAENVEDLLRQAESAVGDRRRTIRFMRASTAALNQGNVEKAVEIANRIEIPYERKIQVSLVLYQAAMNGWRHNELDQAYKHAQGIEFLPQRVAIFHRMITKLWDKEPERGLMMAQEIWEWLDKSDNTPQKVDAMLKLTTTMAKHDNVRGFEWMQSTVRAANGTDFSYKPPDANRISLEVHIAPDMLDLESGFGFLARIDSERTFSITQSLNRSDLSLFAGAVVCQQTLESGRKRHEEQSRR